MHHGACVNTTLLRHTLLFTLICGRDLRDSAIRGHAEYKPAYSLAFTVSARFELVRLSQATRRFYSIYLSTYGGRVCTVLLREDTYMSVKGRFLVV
jgi:hypothetical protein